MSKTFSEKSQNASTLKTILLLPLKSVSKGRKPTAESPASNSHLLNMSKINMENLQLLQQLKQSAQPYEMVDIDINYLNINGDKLV